MKIRSVDQATVLPALPDELGFVEYPNTKYAIVRLPIKSQGIEWKKGMVKKSIGNRAAGKEERLQRGKG